MFFGFRKWRRKRVLVRVKCSDCRAEFEVKETKSEVKKVKEKSDKGEWCCRNCTHFRNVKGVVKNPESHNSDGEQTKERESFGRIVVLHKGSKERLLRNSS